MTLVGELALWIGLFLALWGSAASFAAAGLGRPELAESARRATLATAVTLALSCAGLWAALLGHDFSLEYVTAHTTSNTPVPYLVTAFWGGPEGTLLWWSFALAACAALAGLRRHRGFAPGPAVVGVLAAPLALALAVVCFGANPFDRVEWVPGEGRGLAPALQNPLAAPHFVALYGAYAAAVPSIALAAAARQRPTDAARAGAARGWMLLSWCLLTAAIALRMRWTYTEPALGGDWSWDAAQAANWVLWLMAAGLVWSSARRAATAVTPRGWRASALYALYLGLAMVGIGVAARRSWTAEVVRLQPGQAAQATDPYRRRWRFVSQGVSRDERPNYLSTGVAVEAWRGGESRGVISAERRQYLDGAQRAVSEPATEPGIRSSISLDVYVLLTEVRLETAELRIGFRPLVWCVWAGWVAILIGAVATALQLTFRRDVRAALVATRAA